MDCIGLTKSIRTDCDNPIITGVNDRIFMYNFDDIKGVVRDGDNELIIESITLKAVKASGVAQITAYADLLEGTPDTIEVNGVTFTAQAGPATLGDPVFQADVSNAATAASLVAQINSNVGASADVKATLDTSDNTKVNIVAKVGGVGGNAITLTYTDNGAAIGATVTGTGTLAGGAASASAFEYIGKNNSNEPLTTMEKTRYNEAHLHEVRIKVFSNDPDVKKELQNGTKTKKVVVVQNNDGDFEVYGIGQGLVVKEMVRNPLDAETGGAWDILLGSDDNVSKEPRIPETYFDTDFDTTLTNLQAQVLD